MVIMRVKNWIKPSAGYGCVFEVAELYGWGAWGWDATDWAECRMVDETGEGEHDQFWFDKDGDSASFFLDIYQDIGIGGIPVEI